MLLDQQRSAGPIQGLNAFLAGALVVILATALLPGLLYGRLSPQATWIQPYLPQLASGAQLLAFFGDGALAGVMLGMRRSQTLGFGIAFVLAGYFTQKTVFYLRFFPAHQSPLEAILWSAVLLGLGFGLAGAVCGLATRRGTKLMVRSWLGFSLGGATGGVLLTLPLWIPVTVLANGWDRLAATLATPGSLILPHLVGGAILGSALRQHPPPR